MTNSKVTVKKKIMTAFICIAGAVITAAACLMIAAAVMGRRLTVSPSRELQGVEENVRNALWYSSLAANSHNAQSWKVKIYPRAGRLEVRVDEGRTLPATDPQRRETYISIGCYIETLKVAFDAYGYDTSVLYDRGSDTFTAAVTFTLRKEAATDDSSLSLIGLRHTDKSPYSRDNIRQEHLSGLLKEYGMVECYQRGTENFEYLKRGTLDAVTVQSEDQNYRGELAAWLRFSDKEAGEKLDGISADMMGLKGIVKTFYYWTTNRESAAGDGFARQSVSTAKKQVENCGAFFAVTGGNSPSEWVDAGRNTQAFWFACTKAGISLQPVSAMLETEPFSAQIQDDLSLSAPVQMILRAGYVKDYGSNSNLRRNLADYIEVAEEPT